MPLQDTRHPTMNAPRRPCGVRRGTGV